jgi:hypothetical protein
MCVRTSNIAPLTKLQAAITYGEYGNRAVCIPDPSGLAEDEWWTSQN